MRVVAFVLSLAAAALAQRISIGAPTEGETLTAGLITSISVIKPVRILPFNSPLHLLYNPKCYK